MVQPSLVLRRALLAGLVPCLLSVAAAPAGAAQGGEAIHWLPENTAVHVELSGAPCAKVGDALALARIWAEPEMQQFVGRLTQMGQSQMQLGMSMLQMQLGLPASTLDALAHGRLSLSLVGLVRGTTDSEHGHDTWEMPDMVFTWDYQDDPEALGEILSALETMAVNFGAAEFVEEPIDGYPVRRVQIADTPFPMYCVVDGGTLIFASVRDTLAGCLQRRKSGGAGLSAQPRFAEAWARTHREHTVLFAYLDMVRTLQLVAEATDNPDVDLVRAFVPYESIAIAEDLDGPGVWDRWFCGLPADAGMRQLFGDRSGLRTPAMVPADVAFFSAGNLSYTGLLDWGTGMAEQMEPGMVERALAEFQQHTGLRLREDLLAKMGPETAFYASFPRRRLIPDLGLLLESPDPAGLQGTIEKLIGTVLPGTPIRSIQFGQDTIRYADLAESEEWRQHGDSDVHLRPSWVIVDQYLFLTPWPNAAKEFLANLRGSGSSLQQNPDYAMLAARPSGAPAGMRLQSSSYFDLQALVEFALDNGWPVAQLMLPTLPPQVPVDFADLPRPEVITRHLFGAFGRQGLTDRGLYRETYSPTGMVLPLAILMGGAATTAMRVQQQREAAMMAEIEVLHGTEDEY